MMKWCHSLLEGFFLKSDHLGPCESDLLLYKNNDVSVAHEFKPHDSTVLNFKAIDHINAAAAVRTPYFNPQARNSNISHTRDSKGKGKGVQ